MLCGSLTLLFMIAGLHAQRDRAYRHLRNVFYTTFSHTGDPCPNRSRVAMAHRSFTYRGAGGENVRDQVDRQVIALLSEKFQIAASAAPMRLAIR